MKAYTADAKLIILLVLSHVASQHVSTPFRRLSQRTPTKWLPPFRQLPNRGHGQSGKRSRTVFMCARRRMFNTSFWSWTSGQKHSLHIIGMSIPICSPIPCSLSHNSSMSIIIIIPVIAATPEGFNIKNRSLFYRVTWNHVYLMLGKLSPNDRTIQVSDFFLTQIYVYGIFISEQTLARPCQRNLICKFELAIGKCQGPLWREHLITIGYALVSACTYGQCGHISAHMALGEILRPFFSWLRRNQQLQMYQPWICLRMAMTFPLQPKSRPTDGERQ